MPTNKPSDGPVISMELFPFRDDKTADICKVLDQYLAQGVETIFILRGDPPRETGFIPHPKSFAHASDLISFIRGRYDFDLGCAGYPEGHVEAQSLEKDIEYLKLKVESGAQ